MMKHCAQRPQVLVVESSPEMAGFLADALWSGQYEPIVVPSGREAKQRLTDDHTVNLIVWDLDLGDGSGMAVCSWIRHRLGLPVVVLSGLPAPQERALGVCEHLQKPFAVRQLLDLVGTLVLDGRNPT